jgi:hypothetical protein
LAKTNNTAIIIGTTTSIACVGNNLNTQKAMRDTPSSTRKISISSKGPRLYLFSSHSSLYALLSGFFAISAQRKGVAIPSEINSAIMLLVVPFSILSSR